MPTVSTTHLYTHINVYTQGQNFVTALGIFLNLGMEIHRCEVAKGGCISQYRAKTCQQTYPGLWIYLHIWCLLKRIRSKDLGNIISHYCLVKQHTHTNPLTALKGTDDTFSCFVVLEEKNEAKLIYSSWLFGLLCLTCSLAFSPLLFSCDRFFCYWDWLPSKHHSQSLMIFFSQEEYILVISDVEFAIKQLYW